MPSTSTPQPASNTEAEQNSASSTAGGPLNINVGILGHVDSGKTSLVKALSTHLSTAALDKSKQSRERGMTLDLGFSCFYVEPLPSVAIAEAFPQHTKLQLTLVDCPGHASLIRTIIGGAQIIDVVILVIDAVKGWQAQTTECLVLAELCSRHLVIALNKVDQLVAAKISLEEAKAGVRRHLAKSQLFHNAPIVGVSACVGGEKVAAATDSSTGGAANNATVSTASTPATTTTSHLDTLLTTLWDNLLPLPTRPIANTPFVFAVDHCFPVKGRGTVVTGTCLSGTLTTGQSVAFPDGQERKIKSCQVFRRNVPSVYAGDRAGLCVSHLDATLLERGLVSSKDAIQNWWGAIAIIRKVPYFTGTIRQQSKCHVSVGHTTVLATITVWGARELAQAAANGKIPQHERHPRIQLDYKQDFLQQPEGLLETLEESAADDEDAAPQAARPQHHDTTLLHWAWLDFGSTPVRCPPHSLIIGSRLDTTTASTSSSSTGTTAPADCRLAFSGRLMQRVEQQQSPPPVRWYVPKERRGVIARLGDAHVRSDDGQTVRYEVFGTELFKKETDMKVFIGMKVATASGDIGEIKSSFGTAGKCRIVFPGGTQAQEGEALVIRFKRYTNDPLKAMHQDDTLPPARPGARIQVETKKRVKEAGVHRFGQVANVKGDVLENGKYPLAIIAGFFAPEVNIKEKVGRTVVIPGTGEEGTVTGPFGKAGKCKVSFEHGISASVGDKAELLAHP